ncbi:MAG: AraC family transcriptional regulator [Roseivirga sp.]|nr:AraC family transcriptional regulator [Roseivirga sp.]
MEQIDILRHIRTMYFSTSIIWDLIEYGKIKGADVSALENNLFSTKTQKYVAYDDLVGALNYLHTALDDDCLGLHIAEHISLKVTAPVNSIMLESKTLEESIKNAIDYSRLISDALDCSLETTDNHFSVIYQENPNWTVYQTYAKQQVLDMALLSNVKSLAAYTGHRCTPLCIHFNYPKPKNLHGYYRLFNCQLRFNRERSEIIFERNLFNKHAGRTEYGLLKNLKAKAAEEIKNLGSEHELILELKKHILNQKPARTTIDDASQHLNQSRRTLQRKLKDLDTSFKRIEYELQLRLAKTYLEEQQKSIDEISYLLGFSESSVFIRFFKSLTSQTPLEYQKHPR